MLDLGFLPDVERILEQTPTKRQTMLFSATMPGPIVTLSRRSCASRRTSAPRADENRTVPQTPQFVYRAHNLDKPELLARVLQSEDRGLMMVFCRTKRTARRSPTTWSSRGFAAAAVHGDLGQGAREQALRAFRSGKVDVLVATDVAARGIDVTGVTHVVNYQCPEDEKTYVHRIGRTGRAGSTGVAVTFVDWDDIPRWQLINKALDLAFADPPETYSTSPCLHRPRRPRRRPRAACRARSAPARAWTPRRSRTSARPAGARKAPRRATPRRDAGPRHRARRRTRGRGRRRSRAAQAHRRQSAPHPRRRAGHRRGRRDGADHRAGGRGRGRRRRGRGAQAAPSPGRARPGPRRRRGRGGRRRSRGRDGRVAARVRLLLLADTHVPKRARDLPTQVWAEVDGPTSSCTPATGSTSRCSTRSRSGRARLLALLGQQRRPGAARAAARGGPRRARGRALRRGPRDRRRGRPGAPGRRGATPTSTCWCSGTATSPGTPRRPRGLRLLNPGLAHRPPPPAGLHLPDGRGRGRRADGRGRCTRPRARSSQPLPGLRVGVLTSGRARARGRCSS